MPETIHNQMCYITGSKGDKNKVNLINQYSPRQPIIIPKKRILPIAKLLRHTTQGRIFGMINPLPRARIKNTQGSLGNMLSCSRQCFLIQLAQAEFELQSLQTSLMPATTTISDTLLKFVPPSLFGLQRSSKLQQCILSFHKNLE